MSTRWRPRLTMRDDEWVDDRHANLTLRRARLHPEDITRLADTAEPVVREILTDGVALIGSIPRMKSGVG